MLSPSRPIPRPPGPALLLAIAAAALIAAGWLVLKRHDHAAPAPPATRVTASAPTTTSTSTPTPAATTGPCPAGSPSRDLQQAAPAPRSLPGSVGAALDLALRSAGRRIGAPAVSAAVVVCGRIVWDGADGVLALGASDRADDGTLFVLNSAAKTYVATMVMQEIQAGRLTLSTRLSQFYPELPDAQQITVRMLLNMTSGLPDYLSNPRIEAVIHRDPRHRWTVNQVLTAFGSGIGVSQFPAGTRFEYSDTNYIVLGAILDRVTHRPLQSTFQRLIAGPLGLTAATWVPTAAAEANVAHPYLRERSGAITGLWIPGYGVSSAVWGPVFTDGGLASSSLDVAWFANALFGDRLLDAAAVRQMSQIGPGDYGFGLRARTFDGHDWLGHRGYFGGFESEDWTDPARQVTVAVATDLQPPGGEPISTLIWNRIAHAYDADPRYPQPSEPADGRSSEGAPSSAREKATRAGRPSGEA